MGSVTALPQGRPLTVDDLDALRGVEDGHRYELVDGSLVVTPAPKPTHQVAAALARALHSALPPGLQVFMAPVDVHIDDATVLQPDVVVVARSHVGERFLQLPLLAVEVLSPSTRDIDLALKKARYERAGCKSYWVVDPDGPHLTAWDLHAGRYERMADATGQATVTLERPFNVTLRPSDLLE